MILIRLARFLLAGVFCVEKGVQVENLGYLA